MADEDTTPPEIALRLNDPRVMDARGRLLDLSGLSEQELGGVVRVMDALFRWRDAERRVSEASQKYMHLGETDMRAIRFVIAMTDQGRLVTARDIATHLSISSASTTKLIDRLERDGHMTRTPHPADRRAITVRVAEETRTAAERTIGLEHARRFRVAAALTPDERETVIKFLNALSETNESAWGVADNAGDAAH